MYPDDEARKRVDTMYIVWTRNLKQCLTERLAAMLAAKHRGGIPIEAVAYRDGAYNRCYRMTFREGPDAIVRLPILGKVALRREKVNDELCIMGYITRNTSIPLPKVLGSGICAVGPYMVMNFAEGSPLGDYLSAPLPDRTRVAVLEPEISISKLKTAYREMARVLLELSRSRFSRIGAPTQNTDGAWSVYKRPLTYNINELLTYANFPPQDLHKGPFSTANEYFLALAEDHLQHLRTQRNDAVDDEADCKKKYVARCLFRNIARNFSTAYNNGPFSLFCDDLRPSNVLVDSDLHITSVIDWEYCYAAPLEFTYCSPWWLLLAHPDSWENGFNDFFTQYMPRQKIFLEVLRECEDEAAARSAVVDSPRLSEHMEQSIHNGSFWFCLAARSSFSFDDIYWEFIDQRYYGEFTSVEDRMALLSEEERAELGGLYHLKMEQEAERKLDEHRTLDEILAS
uniref:Putative phosphotransferase n=1 Tax=Paecilomyces divaricatus TaxID=644132 RepID=A0A3G1IHK9_PAEDI|nr:putative phosphotransferase [Paecilomyces divaricatus]